MNSACTKPKGEAFAKILLDELSKEIIALLENKEKVEAMRLALATLTKPNATEKIVEEIKKLIA